MQRKKLTLLPRSEHPQEPPPTPVSSVVEEVKPKSNPFGAARPVDTDSALKKVEEKLAKEKEHKEDLTSAKAAAVSPPPSSPTGPRHDKGRQQPKQLLRRPSANPANPASPATLATEGSSASRSEIDDVVAAKAEAQEESLSEPVETWRKPDIQVAATPQEEEPGWETVPSRSKKVNGVGARH
jgi:hypothetical protein